jgi:tRNA modification GTPase
MQTDDTIAALSTPRGVGALAVLRVSGAEARVLVGRLMAPGRPDEFPVQKPFLAELRWKGKPLDRALVTYFRAPRSFTGEDVVEISCHGSPYVTEQILAALYEAGGRPAEPGEFSFRAFLHGKLDLAQAEAMNDLIRARTAFAAQVARAQMEGRLSGEIGAVRNLLIRIFGRLSAAVDFVEDDVDFGSAEEEMEELAERLARLHASYERGRLLREGACVALVGAPNVGKSTLFNRLVGRERAIVTDVPGTTRDAVSETVDVGGLAVTFFDTAGMRKARGRVEREGVRRSEQAVRETDLLLVVLDSSRGLAARDTAVLKETRNRPHVVVWNKCDLKPASPSKSKKSAAFEEFRLADAPRISAKTGEGLHALERQLEEKLVGEPPRCDELLLTNARHRDLVGRAREAVERAGASLEARMSEELVASDVRLAVQSLGELTGVITTEDVLDYVFGNFCIGK